MASFLGANSKRQLVRNNASTISVDQKAAHLETLLRKLYAKCDELESICKEEKEVHQVLKSKGRRGLPKIDQDCLSRVVASQQRCAENAFNKLDAVKRGNRSSGRKKLFSNGEKESVVHFGADSSSSKSMKNSSIPSGGGGSQSSKEINKSNDFANYGSLDRNIRKKKGSFLERNRRNTKTVGSLAGLDVVDDSVELLKPDEQYNFGLPTVDNNKGMFDNGSIQSWPHQLFSINSRGQPQPHNSHHNSHHHHHHHQQQHHQPPPPPPHPQQLQHPHHHNHLPSSHSFGHNWPIQPPPPPPQIVNYGDGFQRPPVFHSRSSTIHDISTSDIPFEPVLESTTEVVSPIPFNNNNNNSGGSDYLQSTDVNFNCLTISSPTDTSERGSSRSSENGDSKNNFMNESIKPFEMSDYYKYSTKYRSQKKGKIQSSKHPDGKIQRVNGTSDLRAMETMNQSSGPNSSNVSETLALPPRSSNDSEVSQIVKDNFNHHHQHQHSLDNGTAPELPPKMRPNLMYNNNTSNIDGSRLLHHSEMHKRKHSIVSGSGQENDAWIHVNPTIV